MIQLDVFNRSETSFISSYSITSSGLWNFVASNPDRLKCSLVHNPSAGNYSFLMYDEFAGTFNVTANLAQSSFPASLNSLNSTQMSNVLLGENCDLFKYSNQIFTVSSTGVSAVSGLSSPIQATSSDLQYVVSGNTLSKYSGSGSYSFFTSLTSHTNYWVRSFYNQIIVWGASSTSNGNGTNTVSQNINFILDSGSAQVLEQISFTAFNNINSQVQVSISPEMTKVLFEYQASSSNTTTTVSLYDINWYTPAVYNVSLVNPLSFSQSKGNIATFTMTNFNLGDYYLVIRNGSIESTYQFIGEELIPLRTRTLQSWETNTAFYMTYVDDYFLNQLYVLDLYYNGDSSFPGYDIYEYSYGNLAQTVRIIPPAQTIYFNTTLPAANNLIFSSKRL